MKKTTILLLLIILLATILRLWMIGSVPASPDWDEVANGYNAYSLLHTGRDEYGKVFPFVLKSFGDYKPALYSYLIIPFLLIFDLSIVAVRMPAITMGIGMVIATYFLVRKLFQREEIALISALLLAISPWHLQFSRTGFEASVGAAFIVFTALVFISGLKRHWLLLLSAVIAGLNIYVYQSEKIFTPLFFLLLIVIFRKSLLSISRKYLFSTIGLFVLLCLPMFLYSSLNPRALERAKATSIFTTHQVVGNVPMDRLSYDKETHNFLSTMFDNQAIAYGKTIAYGYLVHFDPNWLFITGDQNRHHAPEMGLMYLFEFPFLLIGIFTLISYLQRKEIKKEYFSLLLGWFFLTPLPASITTDIPHAVRTLHFLPVLQIFTAIGLVSSYMWIRKHLPNSLVSKLIFCVLCLSFMLNFVYYLNQYFVQQNYFYSEDWQYGYQQAVAEVERLRGEYSQVIVSNDVPMDQSHMFFLFYMKYPPQKYQQETKDSPIQHHFDHIQFRAIHWDQDKILSRTLFIGAADQFPPDVKAEKTIYYLDGKPAIKIVTNK